MSSALQPQIQTKKAQAEMYVKPQRISDTSQESQGKNEGVRGKGEGCGSLAPELASSPIVTRNSKSQRPSLTKLPPTNQELSI